MLASSLSFLAYCWRATDGRLLFGSVLTLVAALTEGLSLVLLVPILALATSSGTVQVESIPFIGQFLSPLNFSLQFMLFSLVCVIIAQAALLFFKATYNARIFQNATDKTRMSFFNDLGMARWECFNKSRLSDLDNVLMGEIDRIAAATYSMQSLIQSIILLTIYTALAALVSWQMTLFALLSGSTLFLLLRPIRSYAARHGRDLTSMYEERGATVLEFLNGMRVAKSFTAEEIYISRFKAHLAEFCRKVLRYAQATSLGTFFFQVGSAIIGIGFVWLAIEFLKLDFATIAFLIIIFLRLVPRFLGLQDSLQTFLSCLPAFENFEKMSHHFATQAEPPIAIGVTAPTLKYKIEIKELQKIHEGASSPSVAIDQLSICAGGITALVGFSGAGKSTLADLLLGLTTPSSGVISIDGTPLTDENRKAWRQNVAFVQQDPFLFHDTILANLLLARPEANETAVWEALSQANVADFVRGLPEGLKTIVGDRGARFSGGERQRLVLARALLRKPQLLILDEATSALDQENEAIIAKTIQGLRGSMTIITIAHRSSMISLADDVIVLENGIVVEAGPYQTLSSNPNSYVAAAVGGIALSTKVGSPVLRQF
jgi:ATP-binding cassette, subfamily C, bacterial